jgi:hypothetical protein
MPVLNLIDAAYVGPEPVAGIWSGVTQVWPTGGVPQDIQVTMSRMYSGTTTNLTIPSADLGGVQVGDVIYIGIYASATASGLSASGGGVTWVSVGGEQVPTANTRMQLVRGVVTGPISSDLTLSASSVPNVLAGTIVVVRGADNDMPEDDDATSVTVQTTAVTSASVPGQTITTDGAADLLIALGDNDAPTAQPPMSVVGMLDVARYGTATGTDASSLVAINKNQAPGTAPSVTIQQGVAYARFVAWRIPIKPATVEPEQRSIVDVTNPYYISNGLVYHQWTSASTSNVTSGTYQFMPNSLALVFVGASRIDSVAPVTPTVSGGGQTSWDLVDEVIAKETGDAARVRGWVFRSQQAVPGTAAAITVSFGTAPARASIIIGEVHGVPAAGDNGASAIGDIDVIEDQSGATNLTRTLTLTNNRSAVAMFRMTNSVTANPLEGDRIHAFELNNGSNNFLSTFLLDRMSNGTAHVSLNSPAAYSGMLAVEIKATTLVPKGVGGSVVEHSTGRLSHVFRSSSRFHTFRTQNTDMLAVGGGGGGGGRTVGGGGGGGGVKTLTAAEVSGSYAITVGAGGAGGDATTGIPVSGGQSSVGTLLVAGGGGGGGYRNASNIGQPGSNAVDGGNGGGGGSQTSAGPFAGGTSTGGGFSGGSGNGAAFAFTGGGGGGASENGTSGDANTATSGPGGDGVAHSSIWYYTVGGGGSGGNNFFGSGTPGPDGGIGGGGRGGGTNVTPVAGATNTGGGGGGAGSGTGTTGGAGGSGIVVITYDV